MLVKRLAACTHLSFTSYSEIGRKLLLFPIPLHLAFPLEFREKFGPQKTRIMGIPGNEDSLTIGWAVLTQYQRVTDGRTDVQPIAITWVFWRTLKIMACLKLQREGETSKIAFIPLTLVLRFYFYAYVLRLGFLDVAVVGKLDFVTWITTIVILDLFYHINQHDHKISPVSKKFTRVWRHAKQLKL